jgi:hypothetical protein
MNSNRKTQTSKLLERPNYSVRELAQYFGTSVQHWLDVIRRGELLAVDLRSAPEKKHFYRVPRAALGDYLRRHPAEPRRPRPAPDHAPRPLTLSQFLKQFIEREVRRAIARQLRELNQPKKAK